MRRFFAGAAFVVVAVVIVGCGGGDTSESERPAGGVVVDKSAEHQHSPGVWDAIPRSDVEGEQEGGLWAFDRPARLRLTIRDAPELYPVDVSPACFDAVAVGDAWPTDIDPCRGISEPEPPPEPPPEPAPEPAPEPEAEADPPPAITFFSPSITNCNFVVVSGSDGGNRRAEGTITNNSGETVDVMIRVEWRDVDSVLLEESEVIVPNLRATDTKRWMTAGRLITGTHPAGRTLVLPPHTHPDSCRAVVQSVSLS